MTVYDYMSGDALDGEPSDTLVEESEAVSDTGAVLAYRDQNGVWHHVPSCDEDHYRRNLREDVITVYVM